MEVLRTMRAMRRLKPGPVPRDLLERLVEAATWAPSASNGQQYSYVVVTDRAQMARLGVLSRDVQTKYLAAGARLDAEALVDPGTAAMLETVRYQGEHRDETPAVIAVCYARSEVPRDLRLIADLARAVGPRFLRRLASPAAAIVAGASSSYPGVQNLLIAARASGLAANITVWHFFAENEFKRSWACRSRSGSTPWSPWAGRPETSGRYGAGRSLTWCTGTAGRRRKPRAEPPRHHG